MMLIGELKSWLSAFADDEEVAIVDCGGLSLETRTEGLAVGGWPEDGEESARNPMAEPTLSPERAKAIQAGYRLKFVDDVYASTGWYWYTPWANVDDDGYGEGSIENTEQEAWSACCVANQL